MWMVYCFFFFKTFFFKSTNTSQCFQRDTALPQAVEVWVCMGAHLKGERTVTFSMYSRCTQIHALLPFVHQFNRNLSVAMNRECAHFKSAHNFKHFKGVFEYVCWFNRGEFRASCMLGKHSITTPWTKIQFNSTDKTWAYFFCWKLQIILPFKLPLLVIGSYICNFVFQSLYLILCSVFLVVLFIYF